MSETMSARADSGAGWRTQADAARVGWRASRPLVPAALLLLFAGWSGTLWGAASVAASIAGQLALITTALLAARSWRDPLDLGRRWSVALPATLMVAAVVSLATSDVPRAGWPGMLWLPIVLLVPSAVVECWSDAESRRKGLQAVVVVVGLVAGWALVDLALLRPTRAAMPLGHHNLLGAWLVGLLPFAVVALVTERGRWRLAPVVASVLGVSALLASGSLAATVALTVEGIVAAWFVTPRLRPVVAVPVVVLVAAQGSRLQDLVRLEDASALARLGYLEAGLRGFAAHPWLGSGPGSSAWTLADYMTPRPGVHPPGQVVPELHSLVLQLGYELGGLGLALVGLLVGRFVVRRFGEVAAVDQPLRGAAMVGLLGFGVVLSFGGALSVTALPVAVAVVVGCALTSTVDARRGRGHPWPTFVYAALLVAVMVPIELAAGRYSNAASGGDARATLQQAVRLDPGFPLYRFRLAIEQAGEPEDLGTAARQAERAARTGSGLAPLWLGAGLLGHDAAEPWAAEALTRACQLDPLGFVAPYYLMLSTPDEARAAVYGARAILAEPRLGAATIWRGRESLWRRSVGLIDSWPGVSAGWREGLRRQASNLDRMGWSDGGPAVDLVLMLDQDPATSVSLLSFRRRPWPARLGSIPLDASRLAAIDIPSAAWLPETAPSAFLGPGCGAPRARD